MTKRCSGDVKSPWFFIEDQIPNKDGTAFIVWDEFLDHEIKPIRWSDKIQVMSNGVEASYFGDMMMVHQLNHQEAISNLNFLFWR